jgi:LemA protein
MIHEDRTQPVYPQGIQPRRASFVPWLVVPLLILAPLGTGLWLHNGLVSQREAVDSAWAHVESNYQRRADLIPALVQAVKRHMRYESETLKGVVAERNALLARLESAQQQLASAQRASTRELAGLGGHPPASQAELERVAATQEQVGLGIRQVFALAESYPMLRSADHFLELQAQLEGSENRINVARIGFNEAVRSYNSAIQQLPTSYIAEARGYERRAYFKADEGARRVAPLGLD